MGEYTENFIRTKAQAQTALGDLEPEAMAIVVIQRDATFEVFAVGNTETVRIVGMLSVAQAVVMKREFDD